MMIRRPPPRFPHHQYQQQHQPQSQQQPASQTSTPLIPTSEPAVVDTTIPLPSPSSPSSTPNTNNNNNNNTTPNNAPYSNNQRYNKNRWKPKPMPPSTPSIPNASIGAEIAISSTLAPKEDRKKDKKPNKDFRGKSKKDPKSFAPSLNQQSQVEEKRKQQELEEKKKREEEELENQRIEEEKKRKIEAEQAALALLQEEERKKKEADEARRRVILEAKIKQRQEVIEAANNRPDATFLKTLDSNLKRNTSFIKKLALLTEEKKEQICTELLQLNLSRYVSEVVNSLLEAKLKLSDVSAAVKICILMHTRYAEFTPTLIPALQKWFAPAKSGGIVAETDQEKLQRFVKRRVYLRLLSDLFVFGVHTDPISLFSVLKWLIASDDTKDSSKEKDSPYYILSLIVAFVKNATEDILGVTKHMSSSKTSSLTENDSESSSSKNSTPPESEELSLDLMSLDQQKLFIDLLENYFMTVSGYLVMEHTQLRERERENHYNLTTRGELAESAITQYDSMRKAYEKLLGLVSNLAETLGLPMPDLPEDQGRTRIADSNPIVGLAKSEGDVNDSAFDDEDTRSFYENLADLKALIPGILLGDATNPQNASSLATSSDSTTPPPTNSELNESQEIKPKEDDEKDKETSSVLNEKEDGKSSGLDALLSRLPSCVSRELIDSAAVEFCYLNSRPNRKKLVKAIFNVPRTSLVLFPYYTRLIASLNLVMKDVGPMLVDLLEEEFNYMFHKKDQINIESKIRNIRLLGELVKFRLFSTGSIFTFLKMCLDDFAHHNIDVACALLEVCGRFLYRSPETHVRMTNMLEYLMRLRHVKNLDSRQETMVENAYYSCKPPDRPVRAQKKEYTPLELYIQHLLYAELTRSTVKTVLKQLRHLSWDGPCEDFLVKCFVKAHRGKYGHIHLMASLISGLASYHESLGVKVVDQLLEEIRVGLENNDFSKQQRRVLQMKLLGELYNYCLFESHLIFDTLYSLTLFGHYSPNSEANILSTRGIFGNVHFGSGLDSVDDFFRVRLVCTLLDTCGQFFDRGALKKRLDRFLVYFQRYILSKSTVPADVDFMIQDTFESLRPKLYRYRTTQEASDEIVRIENEERKLGGSSYVMLYGAKPRPEREIETKNRANEKSKVNEPVKKAPKESDDEDDEENENEDEKEEEEEEEIAGDEEDDEEDDDEEDDDEDDDDEENLNKNNDNKDEEEVVNYRKDRPKHSKEEDDEFDREFAKILQESLDSRKNEARKINPLNLSNLVIPINSDDQNETTANNNDLTSNTENENENEKENNEKGSSISKPTENSMGSMKFKVLIRSTGKKGPKQRTKDIMIPLSSPLAIATVTKKMEVDEEKQQLKKLVLQYEQREEEGSLGDHSASSNTSGARLNQKARRSARGGYVISFGGKR